METQEKKQTQSAVCQEDPIKSWLNFIDRSGEETKIHPVLAVKLVNHPDPEISSMANEYIEKWFNECNSQEGIEQIADNTCTDSLVVLGKVQSVN